MLARSCRAVVTAVMAVAVVGLGLMAAPSASAAVPAAPTTPSAAVPVLHWRACGGPVPVLCASARVPLDWTRPHGPAISLALAKLPATDPKHRIGTLFVNPGGPGDSGVTMVRDDPEGFPAAVRRRFDVIGFDPRFVGESRPVATCMNDDAYAALVSSDPLFPVTRDEQSPFAEHQATFAAACAKRSELAFSSTGSVARDLDLLRQAVGDPRLSYLGYSYGTYLGQVYAELFPTRVRAMVLDGVIDATAWERGTHDQWRRTPFSSRIGSAAGSSQTWGQYLRLCAIAGPSKCALAKQSDPTAAFDRLAARLRDAPIDFGGGDVLDYASLISATTSVLYSPMDWQGFSFELQGLYQAVFSPVTAPAGAGTAAASAYATSRAKALKTFGHAVLRRTLAISDRLAIPRRDRTTGSARTTGSGRRLERPQSTRPAAEPQPLPYDSGAAAFAAVACEDSLNPDDSAQWAHTGHELDEDTPYFGSVWTWPSVVCATWQGQDPSAYRGHFGRRLSAPLLVVSTRFDPATPYEGAVTTAGRYPGSRLLTVQGYGHTSHAAPSPCTDAVVAAYLVGGRLPVAGAHCAQNWVPFPA